MGVGRSPGATNWNPMEDFRWAPEFDLFLKEINRKGAGKTDLVIVGDLLELWQFVEDNCDYGDANWGCTAEDALVRVKAVLKSHASELRTLKEFADSPGDNRVYIIPGNHDAALLYDIVASELINAINASPGKVCIFANGYWRSPDGLVYAEHGHQIEDGDPNSYGDTWPRPFIENHNKTYLIRTWGERFVQKYYNELETQYPIIDNLSKEQLGIKYGVAARGLLLPKDIAKLTKFVFFEVSEDQFIASLYGLYLKRGETAVARDWDVEAIRGTAGEKLVSDLVPVLEKLPLESAVNKIALDKIAEKGKLGFSSTDLTDEQINALCDMRAALIENMKGNKQEIPIKNCPTVEHRTLKIQEFLMGKDPVIKAHLQKYLQRRYDKLSSGNRNYPKFKVFIYGHTHQAHDGRKYQLALEGNWFPKVFNCGAWIRTVDRKQLQKLMRDKNLDARAVLPEVQPEYLPPCYSFVMIAPYAIDPIAELKRWSLDANQNWRIVDDCSNGK
jgi:UDP-2,3-diacylglucosamine pyrophosphatase LpxH